MKRARVGMKAGVVLLVIVGLLLGVAASRADAGGTKIIIGGGVFPHHKFSHTKIIVVPKTVYVPTYLVPSYGRWVSGYWTYQWVPQMYTSYLWVPGHYDPNGFWVEGHYEPRLVQTGYYQPIWVGGSWDP